MVGEKSRLQTDQSSQATRSTFQARTHSKLQQIGCFEGLMLKMVNRKTLFAALPLLMFCTLWVLAAEKQRNICQQLRTQYSADIYYSDRPTVQRPSLISWLPEDYLRKVHGIGFRAEPDWKAIELVSRLNSKRIYFVVEPDIRTKARIGELLPKVQIAYAIGLDRLRF